MKRLKILLAISFLSLPVLAQAPKAPVVSEVQQLKLENLQLKMSNLQQQYTQLAQQKQTLTEEITKANPGYHWMTNSMTGQEGLVPDAAPAKPATKPAAKK